GGGKRPGLVALTHELQALALTMMRLPEDGGEPMTLAGAAFAIENELRRLDRAPFPTEDASLPGGPCSRCPKRTDAQLQFLDGVPEGDSCTHPACWRGKVEAHGKRSLPVARPPEELDETEGGEPPSERPPLPRATPQGSAADDRRLEIEAERIADERALEA